jgi:crossover junction endodeoxyribonuclease RusA
MIGLQVNELMPETERSRHLSITLPFPPSVNNYWLASGNRRYISKRGVDFRNDVKMICPKNWQTTKSSQVHVVIKVYPPDKRRRDLDNLCKAVFDALEHAGIYSDDFQVSYFSVERIHIVKNGRLDITLTC